MLGVITLSRASYRKMWQNLTWAAGYNLLAVPLAIRPAQDVLTGADGPALVPVLGLTGSLELVYALLLGLGLAAGGI